MAVTITPAALAALIGSDEERATSLLAVATAHVNKHAPTCPDPVANECVVRFCGYLAQSDYGTIKREELGPKSVEYETNHAAFFRRSGALALLKPWVIKRGQIIGAT